MLTAVMVHENNTSFFTVFVNLNVGLQINTISLHNFTTI